MKRFISYLILVIIGLVAISMFCCICIKDRYQIVFGNIQIKGNHLRNVPLGCSHIEQYIEQYDETEDNKIIPVCFKIDTITGRVWIYKDNMEILVTNTRYITEKGFEKVPEFKFEVGMIKE